MTTFLTYTKRTRQLISDDDDVNSVTWHRSSL